MKKLLSLLLFAGSQLFSCCPWWHKSKRAHGSKRIDEVITNPLQPRNIAKSQPGQNFAFKYKNSSGTWVDGSIVLYSGITWSKLKESLVRACEVAEYTNKGYHVVIYKGEGIGKFDVFRSDEVPVKEIDLTSILDFKKPFVDINTI